MGVRSEVLQIYEKARPLLAAMVDCLRPHQGLVVAIDRTGFPLAQVRLERSDDLPVAVVVGRHPRCRLSLNEDHHIGLRHALITIQIGRGAIRTQVLDLAGHGLRLADGRPTLAFAARGWVAFGVGESQIFVLNGGSDAGSLLQSADESAFVRAFADITRIQHDPEFGRAELGESQNEGFAGYRGLPQRSATASRGILRLRYVAPGRTKPQVRDLEVDADQLRRGLLVGRYSERCSLGGDGRNLSRVHALVCEESASSLLVYDLASTNGVRPAGQTHGPTQAVARLPANGQCMLGHFELHWFPDGAPSESRPGRRDRS